MLPDESLRRRFEVEQELAARLRSANRADRPALYRTLYNELFRMFPSHDRLVADRDPHARKVAVDARLRLLQPWLQSRPDVFLEVGPGSGWLSFAMCEHAGRVVAVDISSQLTESVKPPANFQYLIFDGITLPLENASVDLAFSYQVIEHQHPEDAIHGLAEMRRVLKPGGRYVLATPHRYSGPHDVSRHFSDEPRGLHLKEWTYQELVRALLQAGFSEWQAYRMGRPLNSKMLNGLNLFLETTCTVLPRRLQRRVCRRLFQGVLLTAVV